MGAKVKMLHKDFPKKQPVVVDKIAFDRVWKEKGWAIVEDEKSDTKTTTTTSGAATPDTKKSDNS